MPSHLIERIPEFLGNHPFLGVLLVVTVGAIVVVEVQRLRSATEAISPARATRLNNSEEAVFIDARKASDFEQGHLPGAWCVPSAEIDNRLKQLEKIGQRPLVLYDDGGLDAGRVARQLARNGFARLYLLDGGIRAWRKAELPIETGGESRKGASAGQGQQKKGQKKKARQQAQSKTES